MFKLNNKKIPTGPGVYFFRDKQRRILYIGKAVNLRNRLKSYFAKQPDNPRIAKLLEEATSVDWQITDSEIEALISESQLIKKYRPPFNIMLRDDKQYFYVGFTNEQFPKIFLSHQIQNTKYKILNTKFILPFTDGSALKTTLRLLRRIFPYCTCKQKHNNYCLNYHIGKCGGICCLKQSEPNSKTQILNFKNEYKKNIWAIKDILSGKRTSLIKKLEKEMISLAKKEKFEEAAELRDKIEKLKKVFENAQILLNAKYLILNTRSGHKQANPLIELQAVLNLPYLPKRIEGYDISNIQGKFATGAMVVFVDGKPDKNQYRKFKIKTGNESNDIAMLKEILTRRFNHPEWPFPDLIIIDGGKGQLNASLEILKSLNLKMSVIALTKDEKHRGSHIYVGTKKAAVPLKQLPLTVKNLILQVDAEAHRFAISYYRKLHGKFGK